MSAAVIFCISTAFLINVAISNMPLPAVTPEYCNSTEYFDSICMKCRRCGRDENQSSLQRRIPDGSCECKLQYYEKIRKNRFDVTCASCPGQMVVSSDKRKCLKCDEKNPYNETTGHCNPCSDGAFVDDGVSLICTKCQQPIVSSPKYVSVCDGELGASPEICSKSNQIFSGGFCLPAVQSDSSLFTIKFENGESVISAFFKEHFNAALHNCKANYDEACELLGNMCTMLLYRISIEINACSEFRKISKKRLDDCPKKQLWLFYIDEEARWNGERDLYRNNVPNIFNPVLSQESSKLHIFAKKYALNGTFLGMSKVKSDNLHLCPESDVEEDIAFTVGTHIERTCKQSIQSLWHSSELVFYELYLANKSNKTKFYPIPVLIRGVVVNGENVNRDADKSKWLLVRRFFLTDRISGVERGDIVNDMHDQPVAKVFRYAAEVSLKVIFDGGETPGTIYPPLLTISYHEATPDDYMKNKKVTVKFSVTYEKAHSSTMKGIMISFAVLGIATFAWSVVQTYSWFRRSGKHAFDLLALLRFLIFMAGNLATLFFTVMFCTCFYLFIFFKRQDVIHTILPSRDQEEFLTVYLVIAFAFKFLHLVHLIFVQCSIDIFFIDWERPRLRSASITPRVTVGPKPAVTETSVSGGASSADVRRNSTTLIRSTPDKMNADMAGVSVWRTYYAASQFAELQSKRKINLYAQLFAVLFFLKVLNFESYALSALNFEIPSSEIQKYVPYSTCCRFALGAAIYLGIAVVQLIVRKGILERFVEDKLQLYVDLCSVSNISVFILVTRRFGYYIHGRSTHGKADVNMKEMHEFLMKEEEDLCGHRGLLPDTEQQTFQILLPHGVHDQFVRLLGPLTSYSQAADRMQNVGGRLSKVDIDRVASTHYMLNKFLSGFIDHSYKDLDYVVKDKVLIECLLDIECYEVADRGYFYNDDGRSFSSILFYGNESILLLFDVLLFSIIDLVASDYVLSTILTFVTAKAIQGLRQSAGRRNLVRKALVDERFLS